MTIRQKLLQPRCWGTVAVIGLTLTFELAWRGVAQSAPVPAPATPPPLPGLPEYLQPPAPPPAPAPREPSPVRPRQLPVRPAIRPARPPVRSATSPSRRAVLGPFPLTFNGELQELTAESGATNISFQFRFTNTSPSQVSIQRVHTSCGCTTAKLPDMPWTVDAGGDGAFDVTMDIRGKRKKVSKMVYLYTDRGFKALTVRAVIPDDGSSPSVDRLRNLQIAAADRQAVFRGDCARCHAAPAKGKQGRALFQAVCAVCHEAESRADMVPALHRLNPVPGEEGWRRWVTHGKAGTLMPAFAEAEGGPLSTEQVDSLVDFLVRRYPRRSTLVVRPPTPSPAPARATR